MGISVPFVQGNMSRSAASVLRGLLLKHPHLQASLVRVLSAGVFDVAVDLRLDSPHFGRKFGTTLSAENACQLWGPPGFAHGFCIAGDEAIFMYKCTDFYALDAEISIVWDDGHRNRLAYHQADPVW